MENMLNEFKEEYRFQYSLYLDLCDKMDELLKHGGCHEETESIRVAWFRERSVMREQRRLAKTLGYTQEDIWSWEDDEYEKHYKDC